jgi:hypothetical protein
MSCCGIMITAISVARDTLTQLELNIVAGRTTSHVQTPHMLHLLSLSYFNHNRHFEYDCKYIALYRHHAKRKRDPLQLLQSQFPFHPAAQQAFHILFPPGRNSGGHGSQESDHCLGYAINLDRRWKTFLSALQSSVSNQTNTRSTCQDITTTQGTIWMRYMQSGIPGPRRSI